MSGVVNLTDYTPVPRFDNTPWTKARIEESATEDGPWEAIQEFTLSPVDDDPENPTTRMFTTDNNTRGPGAWYRVVWVDANLRESPTPAVQNVDDTLEYQPLVNDIAATWLRTRTKDTNGNELGAFTSDTRPTYEQALKIVRTASRDVATLVGEDVATGLEEDARNVVMLRAALQIELSYFGDQISAGRGPYQELKTLYDEAIAALILARKELGADGVLGTDDDLSSSGMPAFADPAGCSLRAPGSESAWPLLPPAHDLSRCLW